MAIYKQHDLRFDYLAQYLHSLLNHIPQGILFIDLEGIVTTYNPAAQALLERDPLDVLFNSYWTFFEDDLFGFSMRAALKRPFSQTSFIPLVSPSGIKRELEIQTRAILQDRTASQEDSTQGLIVIMRDLTEIQRLESIANRNSRMEELGRMAAMIAHEIRNPLGGIKGFASLLHRDLKKDPHLQQLAASIVEGTDSLNQLVTNILDYSRPIEAHLEPCDLIQLIQELMEQIHADKSIKENIGVDRTFSHPSVICYVDPPLFKSALLNLILNGIQAMPEGGNLILALSQEMDSVTLKISDTGKGIPPCDLDKIFSPFFTTKTQGTGLGLPEALKMIQAHGGTIEVESQVGKGSTFTVTIPYHKRQG